MRTSSSLLLLLAAAVIAGSSYLCAENCYLSIGIFALFAIGFVFGLGPLASFYQDVSLRGHECYRFVHSFIISLSATSSLERSVASASEGAEGKLKATLESIDHLDPLEKVEYLYQYFQNDLYKMFLSVLHLYFDQGGDILSLSNSLLEELNRVEEANRQKEKEGYKNLFQYVLLWVMSLGIMVFLRFGMSSFYEQIKVAPVYIGSVGIFFVFMMFSFLIYAFCFTGYKGLIKFKKKEGANE